LGIHGLGGVGKTTLAKEFFNRKNSDYSRSCFLFDVRDYARKGTLNLVQRNLLKCLTGSDHPVDSVAEGIARLRTHLSSANALVIIDDVDHENQLDALLPHQTVLHSNSLILITSRNKNVLTRRVENTSIYKLTGLNPPQAEELFCCYAFNQTYPLLGFESLVKKFLKTCDGLPLSLKVFGALLNGNYDKCHWQYLLNELELPREIQTKLKISYDSLNGREQQIFLDIACFFIGENRDMAIKIWEGSGWNGLLEFQNIQDKCLVEVDSENKIKMHDHLRDLGRDLAKAPGLPRRLWSWKENDIEDLLQQSWVSAKSFNPVNSSINLTFLFLP
jgi:leucine-rich repeat protein SHOC2